MSCAGCTAGFAANVGCFSCQLNDDYNYYKYKRPTSKHVLETYSTAGLQIQSHKVILDFFQASINGSLFFLSSHRRDKGDNKMPPRPLSQRGLKQMDLDFAWRLHAKEVCQEWATWNGRR